MQAQGEEQFACPEAQRTGIAVDRDDHARLQDGLFYIARPLVDRNNAVGTRQVAHRNLAVCVAEDLEVLAADGVVVDHAVAVAACAHAQRQVVDRYVSRIAVDLGRIAQGDLGRLRRSAGRSDVGGLVSVRLCASRCRRTLCRLWRPGCTLLRLFLGELAGEEADKLREAGAEYGAATGRPRRVAWMDLVATRYGTALQGATELALTKLDVLSYLDKIPVCVAYEKNGRRVDRFPYTPDLDGCKPVYEVLPGWKMDITTCREYEHLPSEARDYVEFIEKNVACPIKFVSVGAERDSLIIR